MPMPIGYSRFVRGKRPFPVSPSIGVSGVFFDNFNRADQVLDADPNWTISLGSSGAFSVVNNAVNVTGSGKTVPSATTAPDNLVLDHFAEVTIGSLAAVGTTAILPAIRISSDTSMVGVRQSASSYDILDRSSAGTVIQRASIAVTPVVGDKVRIWAIGNQISMSVNDGAPVSFTTTQALTGTRSGLFLRSAQNIATQYDNFRSGPGAG